MAAITAGHLREILLVIVLGEIEHRRVDDRGRDRAATGALSACW
jgi:hypothetical protein